MTTTAPSCTLPQTHVHIHTIIPQYAWRERGTFTHTYTHMHTHARTHARTHMRLHSTSVSPTSPPGHCDVSNDGRGQVFRVLRQRARVPHPGADLSGGEVLCQEQPGRLRRSVGCKLQYMDLSLCGVRACLSLYCHCTSVCTCVCVGMCLVPSTCVLQSTTSLLSVLIVPGAQRHSLFVLCCAVCSLTCLCVR